MEVLFYDDFNSAFITPIRNYSQLDTKYASQPTFQYWWADRKNNMKYFYFEKKRREEVINFRYGNNIIKTFFTEKDRHIKKYYSNPFASITVHYFRREIIKKDDKIIIKIFKQSKQRDFNSKYFRKSNTRFSLSFNLKNGNFIITKNNNSGKNKKTEYRTNDFRLLFDSLNSRKLESPNILNMYAPNYLDDKVVKKYTEVKNKFLNDDEFDKVLYNHLGFGLKNLHGNMETILDTFIKKRKIKVSNSFTFLLFNFYPTEKYLKKNDRKLIASILDKLNIKSKITIKILHELNRPNINLFKQVCDLFGDKYPLYISKLNTYSIFDVKSSTDIFSDYRTILQPNNISVKNLTDKERENILSILNDFLITSYAGFYSARFEQILLDIWDHINMINELKKYHTELFFKSKTLVEFNNEHREYSILQSETKKLWMVEYRFNEIMLKDVESPISLRFNLGSEENPNYVTENYYPHILKRENEYIEEGAFMHHCVASYSNKDTSVIISIRTKDGNDRVTCEILAQSGLCIQARHFCNKTAPDDFLLALDSLLVKTKKYARLGMLNHTEKTLVRNVINGVEVSETNVTDRIFF